MRLAILIGILGLSACAVQKGLDKKMVYGTWKVASIKTMDREMSGKMLGYPQYEFTKDGKRKHILTALPQQTAKVIDYQLDDSTISYPNNAKLPSTRIVYLTKDTMILENDKVKWTMYK